MKYFLSILAAMLGLGIYNSFKKAKEAEKAGDEKRQKNYKANGIVCCTVLAAVFVVGIAYTANKYKKEDPDAWKTKDNSTMAYVMMQDFVKDHLKSPGPAKFQGYGTSEFRITKNGYEYYIESSVDSQNSFGALLRTKFSGIVKQASVENWDLILLSMDDQEVYNLSLTNYNDLKCTYNDKISDSIKSQLNKYLRMFLKLAPSVVGNKDFIDDIFVSIIEIPNDVPLSSETGWTKAIEIAIKIKPDSNFPKEWQISDSTLYYRLGSGKTPGVLIDTDQEHYFAGFSNTKVKLVLLNELVGIDSL